LIGWLWRWGPVVACMVAIFIESSQSYVPDLPAGLSNYTGHFIAYGALGTAAFRGFAGASWRGIAFPAAWRAVVLASAYGVTDEVHQTFVVHRFPGADDWAFDTLGALTAVLGILLLARLRRPAAK
jgi:VanZ family protein